jgi:hypothetical protein
MNFKQLEEFYKLCPQATSLHLCNNGENEENLEISLKFENLSSLLVSGKYNSYLSIQSAIKFLKNLKSDNKLKKLSIRVYEPNKEEICEYYKILFEKVKLEEFERISKKDIDLEEAKIISSWLKTSSTVRKIELICKISLLTFQVYSRIEIGYFDLIFNALEVNKSLTELILSQYSEGKLNLQSLESLKFIEKNSSIKVLNFSRISFTETESKLLGEYLMRNNSITSLDLSSSNYEGSFGFLQNNILQNFNFRDIWKISRIDFKQLFDNLKSNKSLKKMDFSFGFQKTSNMNIHKFIEIISEHSGNIEDLTLNGISYATESYELHKLLKNPKIQKLSLMKSFFDESSESFVNFFNSLNENNTLLSLNISENLIKNVIYNFQLSNSSIEILDISSEEIYFFIKNVD